MMLAIAPYNRDACVKDPSEVRKRALTYLYLCSLVTETRPGPETSLIFSHDNPSLSEFERELSKVEAANVKLVNQYINNNDFVSFLGFSKKIFTKYYDSILRFKFLGSALDYY
jgi:hypothetical protein